MTLMVLALQITEPFSLEPLPALLAAAALLALFALGRYGRRAGMPRLTAAATAFLQMTLFTYVGVVLSYALAAEAGPVWDRRLASWDGTLGFDWRAVAAWIDSSPLISLLHGLTYHSLIPQMIVVIVGLAALGRLVELRITVCAAIFAGLTTIVLSGLMPAYGNLLDPGEHRNLWPSLAWLHRDIISDLRDGSLRLIDLTAMTGIVTFPSYHAALALIFIWSFRHIPSLATAGSAWAVLTIVSTPLGGGHYAVDVLAGLALGAASLAAAKWLAGWSSTTIEGAPATGRLPAVSDQLRQISRECRHRLRSFATAAPSSRDPRHLGDGTRDLGSRNE